MSLIYILPIYKAGDKCSSCSADKDKGGRFILRHSKFKSRQGNSLVYLACSRYPECKYTVPSHRTSTVESQ